MTLRVQQLELIVAQLPGIWKEEADRAHRAAEREDKASRRSRKKSRDEDLEPDDDELQNGDGRGGAPSWVQPVPTHVGTGEQAAYLAEVRRRVAFAPLKGN